MDNEHNIKVIGKLGTYTVFGVPGRYQSHVVRMFNHVTYIYSNPDYNPSDIMSHPTKRELVASVSAGNYESEGIRAQANPTAGHKIIRAIKSHAAKLLKGIENVYKI